MAAVMDFINPILEGLYYGVVIGVIGSIMAYILYVRTFKVDFEIRKVLDEANIISRVKAKITRDKNGNDIIKLLKPMYGFRTYKAPPAGSQTPVTNGRIDVKAYYVESQGFQYIDFPNTPEDKSTTFDTEDRIFLIDQFTQAQEEGGLNWWDKHGAQTVYGFMMLILVICLLVFYGDIAQPVIDAKDRDEKIIEAHTLLVDKLDGIIDEQQRFTLKAEEAEASS